MINLLTSDGCIQLLHPFLYKPGIEMYQSEVIKETGIPKTRAIRLLGMLTSYGVLREKEKAGCRFYSASLENPVIVQLKKFIMVSRLYEATYKFAGHDIELYLFGSSARGEDTEYSDIDILVISGTNRDVINAFVDSLKKAFEREVNPVIYTPIQYANLCIKDKAFYDQVERYRIKVL